ncbi:MAG: PD-(D/E)XK nuclease family protein, partial [Proteiniphilum sp.]|nr:PD-(D/E)XK nuclease family protein [Proteiniphilum sp.]
MYKIKSLLEQVNTIKKKNDEILDATGSRFNMFRICGVNHYENTHSAIIAEFLSPKGTHGLKHKLLDSFIETLGDDFTIEGFDTMSAKVKTEHHAEDDGRIDITIEDKNGNCLIIENKIYAGDQDQQLIRYNNYAKKKYRQYQILYLTLWGEKASNQSSKEVKYLPISFKDTIIDWLEKSASLAVRLPMVRETILQYINHLKTLTNQDMDTKNKEEILDLLVDNYEAASTIFKTSYDEFLDRLTRRYFLPLMEDYALGKGLEFNFEKACQKWNGIVFRVTKPEWKKCDLVFSAEWLGYIYGIQ